MNERILELAREAGLLVHNPTGVPTKLEKFAQLIVQECTDICDEVQWQYGQYTFTAKIVKDRVKERFGVEE